MSMKIGKFSRAREITPPRQFEVLTGNTYLKNLEAGEVRAFKERSVFTIDEATGSFTAQTDYGNYAYRWTNIGNSSLAQFLCGLDKDYFMNKASASAWREIDLPKTVRSLKSQLIEMRREQVYWRGNPMTKADAREVWEEIEELENAGPFGTAESFFSALNDLFSFQRCFDFCDLPIEYRDTAQSDHFWNMIWPTFTEYLKQMDKAESERIEIELADSVDPRPVTNLRQGRL